LGEDSATTIQDRINIIISDLDLNVNSFAKEIGVTQSTMHTIVGKKHANPGYDIIFKIVSTKFRKENAFVEVDANWLILGKGEAYKPSGDDDPEGFRSDILSRIEDIEKKLKR